MSHVNLASKSILMWAYHSLQHGNNYECKPWLIRLMMFTVKCKLKIPSIPSHWETLFIKNAKYNCHECESPKFQFHWRCISIISSIFGVSGKLTLKYLHLKKSHETFISLWAEEVCYILCNVDGACGWLILFYFL